MKFKLLIFFSTIFFSCSEVEDKNSIIFNNNIIEDSVCKVVNRFSNKYITEILFENDNNFNNYFIHLYVWNRDKSPNRLNNYSKMKLCNKIIFYETGLFLINDYDLRDSYFNEPVFFTTFYFDGIKVKDTLYANTPYMGQQKTIFSAK